MKQFEIIYEENKKLDKMFDVLYNNYDKDIIEKNIVELLVEIGELANETRCFKYWSNKNSSPKEVVLEEYADCFLMELCLCNMVSINMDEEFVIVQEKNIINQFKRLYNIVSLLEYNLDRDLIKIILSNLVNLGYLLNFSDEDIISGCVAKIEKNKKRFDTGF